MSFTVTTFQYNRGVTTCATNGAGVGTVIHGYKSTDTNTTITTGGYFPNNIDGSTDKIFIGDLLLVVASDAVSIHKITALAPFAIGADLFGGTGAPLIATVPVAATDANGIQVIGTTVQLEIADATHAGIVTEFDQNFAGIKMFNSGIKLLSFGGTPTTLNHYEETTHSTTFTNSVEVSSSASIKVLRCGGQVTLMLPATVTTPGQGAPGVAYIANTALPARFRPVADVIGFAQVSNGGVFNAGLIKVKSTGIIEVYNNADLTTAYTTAQINAFYSTPITYTVL